MKIRTILCTIVLVLLSKVIVAQNSTPDNHEYLIWTEELSEKISREFKSTMEKAHVPGAALAIIQNGQLIKKEFFGYADLEKKIPVSDSTKFWLASISKHITTSLILEFEEEGLLSRHDFVKDFIPELPEKWNGIKLEHLMSHTSGIYGYDNFDKLDSWWEHLYADENLGKDVSLEEFVGMLKYAPIGPAPGEVFDYTDTGMDVLAALASLIGGRPFEQLLSEYIFTPAEMNTRLFDAKKPDPNLVVGYNYKTRQLTLDKNKEGWFSIGRKAFGGAGDLVVNLQDIINWNYALDNNLILTEESKKLLWTPYVLNSGELIEYGLGLSYSEFPGGYTIGHNGVAGTEYWKFPESDIDIIVLTNLGNNGASGGLLATVAEEIGLLEDVNPQPLLEMFNKNTGQFNSACIPTGTYSFQELFEAEVFIEEEVPYFLFQGLKYELLPLENCEFLAISKGMYLLADAATFYVTLRDDKLIMVLEDDHSWGSEFEGTRISD